MAAREIQSLTGPSAALGGRNGLSGPGWLDLDRLASLASFGLTILLVAAPIGYLFYGSFRSDSPGAPGAHFTLDNWVQVYATGTYWPAFVNTMLLSGSVAAISVVLGCMLAWIIGRTNAPGRTRLAPLMVVPLLVSSLITTLAWIALCAPNAGFVNAWGRMLFGTGTIFDVYSFQGIVLVLALHYTAFAFISIYAALRSIDGALEEASYMLGAGTLRTAFRMTFPLIWPSLATTFLLIFIFVSENFSVPTLLGSSAGFSTIASWIFYHMTVEPAKPTLAATAGTMLLLVALLGTLWQRRIIRNAGRYVTVGGKGGRNRVADLGRWKYAATGLVCLYLFLSVVLPYCTLLLASFMRFVTPRLTLRLFTTANYLKVFSVQNLLPTQNSLILAALGGAAATLFYVFLTYLIKRSGRRVGAVMEYIVMIPTAMPALVLGVGFVWAYINIPLPIYGTMWFLLIAYLTRFLGQGVRQSRAAFVQISEDLPEAARMLGASPLRAFRDVSIPLLRSSLISLWTILFIFIFMEISITVVIYSPTSITLPVLLWTRMSGGFLTEAFAIAAAQATIVFVVLYVAEKLFGTLNFALNR